MCWPDLVWNGAPLITKRRFDSGGFFFGFWDDHGRNREVCGRGKFSPLRGRSYEERRMSAVLRKRFAWFFGG
jgi:hypothetical protein